MLEAEEIDGRTLWWKLKALRLGADGRIPGLRGPADLSTERKARCCSSNRSDSGRPGHWLGCVSGEVYAPPTPKPPHRSRRRRRIAERNPLRCFREPGSGARGSVDLRQCPQYRVEDGAAHTVQAMSANDVWGTRIALWEKKPNPIGVKQLNPGQFATLSFTAPEFYCFDQFGLWVFKVRMIRKRMILGHRRERNGQSLARPAELLFSALLRARAPRNPIAHRPVLHLHCPLRAPNGGEIGDGSTLKLKGFVCLALDCQRSN